MSNIVKQKRVQCFISYRAARTAEAQAQEIHEYPSNGFYDSSSLWGKLPIPHHRQAIGSEGLRWVQVLGDSQGHWTCLYPVTCIKKTTIESTTHHRSCHERLPWASIATTQLWVVTASDPQHRETTLINHRWSQAVKQTRQKSLIGESNQKLWFSASFEKVTLAKFN